MRITIGETTFETTQAQDEGLDYAAALDNSGKGSREPLSREALLVQFLETSLNAFAAAEDVQEVNNEKERYAAKYAAADAAKRAEFKAAIDAKADAGK